MIKKHSFILFLFGLFQVSVLFAHVESSTSVVFSTISIELMANLPPNLPQFLTYQACENPDSPNTFDLSDPDLHIAILGQVTGNVSEYEVLFFETDIQALNASIADAINKSTPHQITISNRVWTRVTNTVSNTKAIMPIDLLVYPLPVINNIDSLRVCVTVAADGLAEFDLNLATDELIDGANYNVNYYFDENAAVQANQANALPLNYTNTDAYQQTVFALIIDNDTDCSIIVPVDLVVETAPIVNVTGPLIYCNPNYDVDGIFHLPDAISDITSDPDAVVHFYATEADADNNVNPLPEDIGSTTPQVIYARVANQQTSCYAIAEVILEVIPLSGLILEETYSICTDEFGDPIADGDENNIYPIIETGLEKADFMFTWYYEGTELVDEFGPSLEADEIGTYTIDILSHDTGCTLSRDIEVVKSSMPFTFGAGVAGPAFSGSYNIEAWANGIGDYRFSLNGGALQKNGSWNNVEVGTHIVTIIDTNGCDSLKVVVNVVDYPKFFTPNNDGYNDYWNIPGMADLDPSAEIFIFDRHGKLLKQINPSSQGWNGSFNGKPMPSTDYWFIVKYSEDGAPKEFKGHFSLKR